MSEQKRHADRQQRNRHKRRRNRFCVHAEIFAHRHQMKRNTAVLYISKEKRETHKTQQQPTAVKRLPYPR